MGRFKSKKRFNNTIIYIGIFLLSVAFSIKYLYKEDLIKENTVVDLLIGSSFKEDSKNVDDVDFLMKYILNVDLVNDEEVMQNDDDKNKVEVKNEEENNNVDNNKEEKNNEPILYIYNTHQEEAYQSSSVEAYNITPTILLAAKIFKEYLEDEGIGVIVETSNVTEKLRSLNWKYGSSYKVSRMFLESAKENNPSLKYFIDLHRDSSKYENTMVEIDGIKYARLLFVVGLDNPNYAPNLEMSEKLKAKIVGVNERLFRGIMKKSGKGVNGVYNQDFSENTVLIELGGQYNTISEVNNTLKILAKVIADYIKEDNNG